VKERKSCVAGPKEGREREVLGCSAWEGKEGKERGERETIFEIRRYKQNLFEFKFKNLNSIELKQIK
jgi:hypothetical protein